MLQPLGQLLWPGPGSCWVSLRNHGSTEQLKDSILEYFAHFAHFSTRCLLSLWFSLIRFVCTFCWIETCLELRPCNDNFSYLPCLSIGKLGIGRKVRSAVVGCHILRTAIIASLWLGRTAGLLRVVIFLPMGPAQPVPPWPCALILRSRWSIKAHACSNRLILDYLCWHMRHYHVEHGDFRLYWNLVDFTNTRTKMTCKMLGRGFSGALSVWWRPWFGYAYRWFGRALLRRSWFTKVYKFIQGNPIFDSWYCRGISNPGTIEPYPNVMGRPISMRRRKTMAHVFARTLLWTFAWGWSLLELASSSAVCLVLVTIASTDILTFTARPAGCFDEKHTQNTTRKTHQKPLKQLSIIILHSL